MSVPVTDNAEGDVPAPVDAAILSAPEFPFKCLILASEATDKFPPSVVIPVPTVNVFDPLIVVFPLRLVVLATVSVPAILDEPPTYSFPVIPMPPLTVSAPEVVEEEAVALVILVIPLMEVAASEVAADTVKLLSVLLLVEVEVIPPPIVARPVKAEVPAMDKLPPIKF
jgi:hypothetical protein